MKDHIIISIFWVLASLTFWAQDSFVPGEVIVKTKPNKKLPSLSSNLRGAILRIRPVFPSTSANLQTIQKLKDQLQQLRTQRESQTRLKELSQRIRQLQQQLC